MEVSVLPGRERRRKWSVEEKLRIVEETGTPGARIADVARRHGLHPNQLHAWRRKMRAGHPPAPGREPRFMAVSVVADARAGVGRELIEIVLRNGRMLRVRLDLAQVTHLADALEGAGR